MERILHLQKLVNNGLNRPCNRAGMEPYTCEERVEYCLNRPCNRAGMEQPLYDTASGAGFGSKIGASSLSMLS